MTQRLKARRVDGGQSRLILVLATVALLLVAAIAVLLANSGQFKEPTALEIARDEILVALQQSPNDANLLMSLAEVEYEMGSRGDAIEHAAQAVAAGGEVPTINMRYAMLLMREERLEDARAALEAELAVDPTSAESSFLLGQVFKEQGDYEAALGAFEMALAINPVDGDFRVLYAQTLALAGRTDEAIEAYQFALEVLPDDERAIAGLAELGVTYEATATPNPHDAGD